MVEKEVENVEEIDSKGEEEEELDPGLRTVKPVDWGLEDEEMDENPELDWEDPELNPELDWDEKDELPEDEPEEDPDEDEDPEEALIVTKFSWTFLVSW